MKRAALVLMAGWVTLVGSAEAANIDIQWTGGPRVDVHLGSQTLQTYAGDFQITVLDNSLAPALIEDQSFFTFCVDLQHYATTSADASLDWMSNWTMTGGVPPGSSPDVTYPIGTNSEGRGRAAYLGAQYFQLYPSGATDNLAAAYQIAVWEVLYESSTDYEARSGEANSGNVYFNIIDESVLTQANALIAASGSADTGWLKTANSTDGVYGQDFMAPVPEPLSSIGAFALALLSLAGFRRGLRR